MRHLGVIVALAVLLAACGGRSATDGGAQQTTEEIGAQLAALASAAGPRAYYAGDAVAGLPLTHVDGRRSGHALFVYGECHPEGEGETFRCSGPQIQIQNWPLAERHPAKFQLTPTQPAPCRRGTIRGVATAVFTTSGGGLEVYAGRTVVVVFARRDLAYRAAKSLRSVEGRSRPGANLPQPPRHVTAALLRCAVDPPGRKLRELERTATIPFYWVGRSFEGHPLARVEGAGKHARFVYGSCVQHDDFESGAGCWAPLDIEVAPFDERDPSEYSPSIECRWEEARGAPVAVSESAHTVQLFVGTEAVTLVGPDLSLVRRATQALRPLDAPHAPGEPLPAPPAEVRRSLAEACSPAGSGAEAPETSP